MDRAFQRIRSLMLRDTFYSVPPTYRRIIVRETKIGGFLEPAIIKATEFNIFLQPSAQFRIDEITECATSKRK